MTDSLPQDSSQDTRSYTPPAVIYKAALEVGAGSILGLADLINPQD